jgi:hypothetical protein
MVRGRVVFALIEVWLEELEFESLNDVGRIVAW